MLRVSKLALLVIVALVLIGTAPVAAQPQQAAVAAVPGTGGCDEVALSVSKAEFVRLRRIHQRDPSRVDEEEFREAARRYIYDAESCYQARFGVAAVSNQTIDNGGVRMDGSSSSYSMSVAGNKDTAPQHNLWGTKWGAGTSFLPIMMGGNPEADGPRISGGTVTYSYMAGGLSLAGDPESFDATTTAVTALPTFESCFLKEIGDAFGAWSAVSDILFSPVSDGGGGFNTGGGGGVGDIRIAAHDFCTDPPPGPCTTLDGPSGILAHAFFPPPNGLTAAGDLHFDKSEAWACDDDGSSFDLGIVALHEIGHSLGLGHEVTDTAVMEAFYNPALTFGPLADDIIGAGQIYGGSPVGKNFFWGKLGIGTDSPAATLHVLRDDSSARVRVEEASTTTADRTLFSLRNKGGASFSIFNTANSESWFFSTNTAADFLFSRTGTGGPELKLFKGGRLQVGPGATVNFDLRANGDLDIVGDVTGLSFTPTSSRALKNMISSADPGQILEKLSQLPLYLWTFKRDDQNRPHLGPMAEDFFDLFGLGNTDKGINLLDATGVALAAIQALKDEVGEKDQRLLRQQEEIDSLKAELQRLSDQVKKLAKGN